MRSASSVAPLPEWDPSGTREEVRSAAEGGQSPFPQWSDSRCMDALCLYKDGYPLAFGQASAAGLPVGVFMLVAAVAAQG